MTTTRSSPETVVNVANAMLEAVIDYFADVNVALPDRRYVSGSEPAFDCEQLTVHSTRIFVGAPGTEETNPESCGIERSGEFVVTIVRCAPVPKNDALQPPVGELQLFGEVTLRDLWCLFMAMHYRKSEITAAAGCTNYAVVNSQTAEPEGGYAATRVTVQMELISTGED